MKSRVRRIGASLLLVIAIAGCGIGAQSSPRAVDDEDVPFGLLRKDDDQGTDSPVGSPPAAWSVFLVAPNGALVEVERSDPAVEDAQDLLDALLEAPANSEANRGLRSSVPPGTKATVVTKRGVAVVDLESQFLSAARTEQTSAVAQIVYTMTSIPGISHVRFLLDGEAADIPRSDGTLTRSPLGRVDVAIVVPG